MTGAPLSPPPREFSGLIPTDPPAAACRTDDARDSSWRQRDSRRGRPCRCVPGQRRSFLRPRHRHRRRRRPDQRGRHRLLTRAPARSRRAAVTRRAGRPEGTQVAACCPVAHLRAEALGDRVEQRLTGRRRRGGVTATLSGGGRRSRPRRTTEQPGTTAQWSGPNKLPGSSTSPAAARAAQPAGAGGLRATRGIRLRLRRGRVGRGAVGTGVPPARGAARRHIDEGRPRFETDRREREELAERFFGALREGDIGSLQELLAADVQLVGDVGGKGPALARNIIGSEKPGCLPPSSPARPDRRHVGAARGQRPAGSDLPRSGQQGARDLDARRTRRADKPWHLGPWEAPGQSPAR
jgi:hypothetical protein